MKSTRIHFGISQTEANDSPLWDHTYLLLLNFWQCPEVERGFLVLVWGEFPVLEILEESEPTASDRWLIIVVPAVAVLD